MEEYIVQVCGNKTVWRNKELQLHRVNGPAIEQEGEAKRWYLNGKPHRVDGPAVEWPNGTKEWYQNGNYHRTDGPACEYSSGDKFWYLNGQLHRTDGPALEWKNGNKEWYLEGKKYSEEEFQKKINPIIELYVLLKPSYISTTSKTFNSMSGIIDELICLGWKSEDFETALLGSEFILLKVEGREVKQLTKFKTVVPNLQYDYKFE